MEEKKKRKKPIEIEKNLAGPLEDFTGPDEANGPNPAQIYPSDEMEDGIRPRSTTADLAGEEYSRYPAKNREE